MNKRMIFYVLGFIMLAESMLMLIPLLIAISEQENAIYGFLITILALIVIGGLLVIKKPKNTAIYAREGFVIVAVSWITMSLFGAMPAFISGTIPSYVDAFFETVSGFTTTGATILSAIEGLPKSILFWRAFTQWIGGMGVLVFIMAILPLADGRGMHMLRAEVPGPTKGKLVPKIRSTAMILYGMYIVLTALQIVLLCIGGMSLYDSVCTSLATTSTGGYSVMNASIAAYGSAYIEIVTTIFMVVSGINFSILYLVIVKRAFWAFKSEELFWYIGIIAASIAVITLNILPIYDNIADCLRYSFFQVATIISTTGFSSIDYSSWPELSKMILVVLTIIGGCAGSTAGGIKISRIIILLKASFKEMRRMLHPRSVSVVKIDKKSIDLETVRGANTYLTVYIIILALSMLLVATDGFDFETTSTAVFACIGNVGPGFGLVGPTGNYSIFSEFVKVVLSVVMLIGRLEIFPILMLLSPGTWRKK